MTDPGSYWPLSEEEYSQEWERLYEIRDDGDRDFMLRRCLEEKEWLARLLRERNAS